MNGDMKVLWFSLSPCGSMRRNNTSRAIQGWMISLEDAIKQLTDIELSVAYFSDMKEDSFVFDGVTYYPMGFKPKGKINRVIDRYVSIETKEKQKLDWMLDVVQKCNPNIIHIHGTEQSFGSIAEKCPNIPIVYSLQGLVAPIAERFFSGFSKQQISTYKGLGAKLRGASIEKEFKEFYQKGQREVAYLKNAKYILGRTEWDRSISKMINPKAAYFTVNEILREPFFKYEWHKEKFSDKPKFVTILSSSQVYKGYETLIKAARLLKEHTDIDFEWRVVGYGPNDWLAKLGHQITRTTPKECNINLCGLVSAENLAKMMAESDIYVHTSHIENSPNSVCEAMAIGLPVIATYVGGTKSMTGEYAVMVPDGDPYFLAAMIIDTLSSFSKAKDRSESARAIAISRHNPENVCNELKTVYNLIYNQSTK